jgi:hypothetical protein
VEGLTSLETLGLGYTGITDGGLELLFGLMKLQTVYLTNTKATGAGVKALRTALPKCNIDIASSNAAWRNTPMHSRGSSATTGPSSSQKTSRRSSAWQASPMSGPAPITRNPTGRSNAGTAASNGSASGRPRWNRWLTHSAVWLLTWSTTTTCACTARCATSLRPTS